MREFQICPGTGTCMLHKAGSRYRIVQFLLQLLRDAVDIHLLHSYPMVPEINRGLFYRRVAPVRNVPHMMGWHRAIFKCFCYRFFQIDGSVGCNLIVKALVFQTFHQLRRLLCRNQVLINAFALLPVIGTGTVTGNKVPQSRLGQQLRRQHVIDSAGTRDHMNTLLQSLLQGRHITDRHRHLRVTQKRSIHIH